MRHSSLGLSSEECRVSCLDFACAWLPGFNGGCISSCPHHLVAFSFQSLSLAEKALQGGALGRVVQNGRAVRCDLRREA